MTQRLTILQPGFLGGEISPRLAARVDLSVRKFGSEKLENFIVTPEGALTKRTGTKFVHHTKSSGAARLIPFVFAEGDAYMIELGDLYARFHLATGTVRDTHAISAASWAANVATITAAGNHAVVGDRITVAGMTPSGYNKVDAIVTAKAGNDLSYALTPNPGAFSAGGTVADPYEIVSPFAYSDLALVQYEQLGNVIFFVHASYAERSLTRSAATSWAFATVTRRWGPFGERSYAGGTVDPGAASGNNVAIVGTEGPFVVANDEGRHFAFANGAPQVWSYGRIDRAPTNTNNAVIDYIFAASSVHPSTSDYMKGVFNDTDGAQGDNPSMVALFSGRKWIGPSIGYPSAIHASRSGLLDHFAPFNHKEVGGPEWGITVGIASNKQIKMYWMKAGPRALFVGTPTNIIAVSGSKGDAISPTSIEHKPASVYGAAQIAPAFSESELFYIQKSKRRIRRLHYDAKGEDYPSTDLMRQAAHLAESTIEELAFVAEPYGILWCRRADGTLIALTHVSANDETQQPEIQAWTRHTIGGSFGSGDAVVESIAVIPGDGYDQLWMIVKRTINSATVRHIEYLARPKESWDDRDYCPYADSYVEYDGASTATITGLDHLNGQTITYAVDGMDSLNIFTGSRVVSNGSITLAINGSRVFAGFGIESNILSYRVASDELENNQLNAFGKIHHIAVELFDTWGLRYFKEETANSSDMWVEFADYDLETAEDGNEIFSGPRLITLGQGWSRDSRIYLRHDYVQPCNILGYTTHWALERGKEV